MKQEKVISLGAMVSVRKRTSQGVNEFTGVVWDYIYNAGGNEVIAYRVKKGENDFYTILPPEILSAEPPIEKSVGCSPIIHYKAITLSQLKEEVKLYIRLVGKTPVIAAYGNFPYASGDGILTCDGRTGAHIVGFGAGTILVLTKDSAPHGRLCRLENVHLITLRKPEKWETVEAISGLEEENENAL